MSENPWLYFEGYWYRRRKSEKFSVYFNGIVGIVYIGYALWMVWNAMHNGGWWWLTMIVVVACLGLFVFLTWKSWQRFVRADERYQEMKQMREREDERAQRWDSAS